MSSDALTHINLSYWFLQTVAMLLTALIIPGLKVSGPLGALATVVAIAFMNSKLWDAALFFQMPNHLSIQAGLLLLTNGLLFWILVKVLPGIEVTGLLPALVAPIVFTFCSLFISEYGKDIPWDKVLEYVISTLQNLKTYFQESPQPSPAKVKAALFNSWVV